MKRLILIILVSIILGSCEKTIDFNGEDTEPITIVNGVFNPDSTFLVSISQTKHITKSGDITDVTDAHVEVFEGTTLVEELVHTQKGVYKGTTKPISGKSYALKVTNKKKESAATAIVPQSVNIFDVKIDNDGKVSPNTNVGLTINFTDPGKTNNYYRVTVHPHPLDDEDNKGNFFISSNDLIIRSLYGQDSGLDNTPDNEYLVFNDKLIDGKNHTLKLEFYDSNLHQLFDTGNRKLSKSYKVKLMAISKDYYLYLKSISLHNWVNDDPFSEPVPIFSNITGGGGILGAYSASDKIISVSAKSETP